MDRSEEGTESIGQAALVRVAVELGALEVAGVSAAEERLAKGARGVPSTIARGMRERIRGGQDPLGELFLRLRGPAERRASGATYTPRPIVEAMLRWTQGHATPRRIVDPGTGSGRFLVAAARRFPRARLIGVEIDPLAALLARASLAAAGHRRRSEVLLCDYRSAPLSECDGQTLFLGNPPYVRHHQVGLKWKAWLTRTAAARGLPASQLAGLHVHFFLATLEHGRAGDVGAFITAAEWLDVNYGALLRRLFVGPLGGLALHVVEPTAMPFPDATTTAAITCFELGAGPRSPQLRRVSQIAQLGSLAGGRPVRRERLAAAARWTPLTHAVRKRPSGYVELGELCRVHRGQVTGANRFWIAGPHAAHLPPSVLYPTVTRAHELFRAGDVLADTSALRRVVDLPDDLGAFAGGERAAIDRFLEMGRAAGVDRGYIATHRKCWWSIGLHEPAPILATYMARRPPSFVMNRGDARTINIAHGVYPREPLPEHVLEALVDFLRRTTSLADGRTYAGGLTKFEPREMERLLVPPPAILAES